MNRQTPVTGEAVGVEGVSGCVTVKKPLLRCNAHTSSASDKTDTSDRGGAEWCLTLDIPINSLKGIVPGSVNV